MQTKRELIIEGLNINRQRVNEAHDDLPICRKPRELQKVLSDAFSRKYFTAFKALGAESMGVEIYTHEGSDDEDIIRIPDVIYEVTLYIAFDIRATVDVKAVEKLISTTFGKKYPKFAYEKLSKQFYSTSENPDDIFDVLNTLKRDGGNYNKLVTVKPGSEIEREVEAQLREWKEDKRYQEAEYRRDVLGTY